MERGRVARVVKSPALAILLIAPFFGETFSTATAPLDLLLPWRLPIVVGLIDRFWFDPKFWTDTKVGSYSEVWHTNLLLATHLTAFHTAISICASILVVERLFPSYRDRAWAGKRGLPVAAVAFLILVPLGSADFYVPPIPVLIAAGALCVLLAVLLVRRYASGGLYGRDELRVVTGMIAFFLVLDFVIGLGGRYDLSVGAIATAFGLRWLHRRKLAS